MKNYLAIDIGGTFIKSGVMDEEFQEELIQEVPTRKNPEQFLEQLIQLIMHKPVELSGIAICMGGFINPDSGTNKDFSVGENFRAYNLKDKLGKITGLRVAIENDSNCAALAELALGAGKNCNDLCLLTIGTGIGGAIIYHRELIRGKNFKAGEFGFTKIGHKKGDEGASYQAAAATSMLVKRVSDALGEKVDGNYVFDHLEDHRILAQYEDWLEDLALVVGNVGVSLDPDKILIGGGISTRERFINDLRRRVYQIYEPFEAYTTIEACALGNNAGKIGALINFFNQYGK